MDALPLPNVSKRLPLLVPNRCYYELFLGDRTPLLCNGLLMLYSAM
ncbi:MAG: hypothetical protein KME30_32060 [Iphinoe sp. HA4291-MV1]|nr:hypothetical protein [Iphinoe sp. HA4291-MV1]